MLFYSTLRRVRVRLLLDSALEASSVETFSHLPRFPGRASILLRSSDAQQEVARSGPILSLATSRKIVDVGVAGQHLRNILLRLDTSDLNQTVTTLGHSLADRLSCLGFTLGTDDAGLTLLLGLLDDESCPLRLLLSDLLLLDGLGELSAKGHMRDGHVLQSNVEFLGALQQLSTDAIAHGLTLSDEFCRVELGDDGLEDFVSDRGEHTLVVVLTEVLVDLGK